MLGYTIAIIGAVFVIIVVIAFFVVGQSRGVTRRKRPDEVKGTSYSEPQEEQTPAAGKGINRPN